MFRSLFVWPTFSLHISVCQSPVITRPSLAPSYSMVNQLVEPHSLVKSWRQVRGLLETYGPPSLQDLREESIARFEQAGWPTHKSEEYKYTPLRAIEETTFVPAYGATVSRVELRQTPLGRTEAITLAFVNGEYAPELSNVQGLPEGARLLPLQEALEQNQDLVMDYLARIVGSQDKLGATNDDRFIWLNTAFVGEGAFLYLPPHAICFEPIHLLFLNKADHGPFAAFPRVLIVAEEQSDARVLETHQGLGGVYFSCPVTELWLSKAANIEHTRVQLESPEAFHLGNVQCRQASAATWTSNNVQLGGSIGRLDTNSFVDGEGCETWLSGVYMGRGNQLLDNHTRIDHAKPHCNSFEVYKGILDDQSRGVFNGKIFVYQDAQKTDAKQTNQALLLSKDATVDTKPQLEIFADDVKCTHGATVGQLSEEMLFYLRSRGIPLREARALLVYAFAAAGLEKIGVEEVRKVLEGQLLSKLGEIKGD